MNISFVLDDSTDINLVGGKGANLGRLKKWGQAVPDFVVISTELMRTVLEKQELTESLNRRLARLTADTASEAVEHVAEAIQDDVKKLDCDAYLSPVIRQIWDSRFKGKSVSVRSSAIGEDAADVSFAGMHDSFLQIRNPEAAISAIKNVWASAFNVRALVFRLQRGLPLSNIYIAVVVQEMVNAAVSGVIFTVNPNTGNPLENVISSVYGAGEGLVSAGFDADTFIKDKRGESWSENIVAKTEKLVPRPSESGLTRLPVQESLQTVPSLSENQRAHLADQALAIERHCRRPQDIEFCIDSGGSIHILQTRPVTTALEYGPAAGNRLVWDNSNIIESYSGVTTPMTFSFIKHAYTIVYHCFAQVMGIPRETVRKQRYLFENMLGLFNGQVYYNVANWYRLVQLFPGFNYNKEFMESMMGLKDKLDLHEIPSARTGLTRRYCVELPRVLKLLLRSLNNFRQIKRLVNEFTNNFDQHYRHWEAMDFDECQPHELMQVYRDMEEALLWNWKTPIINDFYVMIFYGALKNRCQKWCGDENGSLQNDLICGQGDIESTKPTKLLMAITRQIAEDPQLHSLFQEKSPVELAECIPTNPNMAGLNDQISFYLREYGFRCIDELKLEEPSLRETPEFLYQMIKNYLNMQDLEALDPAKMEAREHQIRRTAEARAFKHLSAWQRPIFRWILRGARRGVRNRENMRLARTKIYGTLRELINSLGKRFVSEGILDNKDDIYYLALEEVWDYIKGTAVTTDLRGLVSVRRKEFEQYRGSEHTPADHFETYGMAYNRNLFRAWSSISMEAKKDNGLKGIGCSPGQVTAPVRIVHSPKDDLRLHGEILVAERTDPGWVPLYPAVSGILIERGSILSHSAIVAREMGIPTIVGIPGLLNSIADGQTVEMDGSTGAVKIQRCE